MTVSYFTAQNLIASAGRGNLRDLAKILTVLLNGGGFITGAGVPTGNGQQGQRYFNTTNSTFYVNTDGNTTWVVA